MAISTSDVMWKDSEWIVQVHEWILDSLATNDVQLTGEITQPHIRPWATAMSIPTTSGTIWFKASTPAVPHESSLTAALSRWAPGITPKVIAAREDRNWLLMRDGGNTLRTHYTGENNKTLLCDVARTYAGLQKRVSGHLPEMLALNCPDCRLSEFANRYTELVEQPDVFCVGKTDGLTEVQADKLRGLANRVAAISNELGSFGISDTVQHDDLHSNNVLLDEGRYTIFDWGDSSVSHPFLSLTVLMRVAERELDSPMESDSVQAVRWSYLNAWELDLTSKEIDRACMLADGLGRISRALTWNRIAVGIDSEYRATHAAYASNWLEEFLESPSVAD